MEHGTTLGAPSSLSYPSKAPIPIQAKKKRRNKPRKKVNKAVEIYKKQNASSEEYSSSEGDDYSDEEDEGVEGYKKGGYHPVKIGDVYKSRYQVLEKLGWGHFSTVWLCKDLLVALKVVKSAKHYTEAALDECKILKTITDGDPNDEKCCVRLLDEFEHRGPNGKHVCMVFEVLGSNLLDLIKCYNYRGIPVRIVKSIAKQILIGLDYLHTQCSVIHTDLKPENVLLYYTLPKAHKRKRDGKDEVTDSEDEPKRENGTKVSTPSLDSLSLEEQEKERSESDTEDTESTLESNSTASVSSVPNEAKDKEGNPPSYITYRNVVECDPDTYRVKIVDFGNSCWIQEHFTNDIQTRQYRAPEVILGMKYGCSVDMWSMGCMVFELLTGDLLFEPKNGHNFDKNDDHLAQMIELLGRMPKKLASGGKYSKDFFNRKGELKYIRNLKPWTLEQVLQEKYSFSEEDAKEISDFIKPMIHFDPNQRATAKQSLQHPWLAGAPPLSHPKENGSGTEN